MPEEAQVEGPETGTVRVAAVAMHSVMGDPRANLEGIEHWAQRARDRGATFALFPEECTTGSLNKSDLDLEGARSIAARAQEPSVTRIEALCRKLGMTMVVGTIEPGADRMRNSALVVGPDGHLATFSKLHLPNQTEREWFVPGDSLPVVTSQSWTFGVGICYDLRFPEIFRVAAQHGAQFFLLAVGGSGAADKIGSDGSQMQQAKNHLQQALQVLPARCVDNALYVFYANQAGHSGRAKFPGLAFALDPSGEFVAEHLATEGMVVVEVSREKIRAAQESGCCTAAEARAEVYATPTVVR